MEGRWMVRNNSLRNAEAANNTDIDHQQQHSLVLAKKAIAICEPSWALERDEGDTYSPWAN